MISNLTETCRLHSCPPEVRVAISVTGQLADTPTHGLPTCGLDDSRIGQWTSRGLVNSRTRQLADWTSRGLDNSRMPPATLRVSFSFFWRHLRDRELSSPRLVQSTSWLVRELSSPRVDQSAWWQSASWRIHELSSYCHSLGSNTGRMQFTSVFQYVHSQIVTSFDVRNIFLPAAFDNFPKCFG